MTATRLLVWLLCLPAAYLISIPLAWAATSLLRLALWASAAWRRLGGN